MRKNSIAIISLAFLASCFMVSCSTEAFDTNQPVKGAKIVIPAQKMSTKAVDAEGKATFLISENVYIAKSGTIDENAIHPSAESASTTFAGTLKGSYSQGDKITVLYNTNASGVVDYSGQDGSIGSVKDAGYAEDVEIVSYSEGVLTTESAKIQNLQSIFKFTFYNGSISEDKKISGIRFVRVFSTNNKLVSSYNAKSKSNTFGPVTISRSDDNLTDNHIYAALRFESYDGDEIVFQVVDNAGNVYSGSKAAPSDGFANGNIYNSSVVVNRYTFTVSSSSESSVRKVCFSPGDLEINNDVFSFTEPFTTWGHGITSDTEPARRVWFDKYTFSLGERTVYGITSWRVPGYVSGKYEWNNIVDRTMNEGVEAYYRVTIPGHQYCLLLPPDETQSTDIGEDLTSGEVTDYAKYLGKGFVLLMNTNRATYGGTPAKWTWGGATSNNAKQGFYWALRDDSNRYFFQTNTSGKPIADWQGYSRMRNHIRYVHNVSNQ